MKDITKEEVIQSCKAQLETHIDTLHKLKVRKAEVEIELIHYIKDKLKKVYYDD